MPTWWNTLFGNASPAPAATSGSGLGGNGANGYMQYQPIRLGLDQQLSLNNELAERLQTPVTTITSTPMYTLSYASQLFNAYSRDYNTELVPLFYGAYKPAFKVKREAAPHRPLKGL